MRIPISARIALLAFANIGMVTGCNGSGSSGLPGTPERTTQSIPLTVHKLYVVNDGDNTVRTYRPDGTQTIPTITAGLNGARGIAVDANGKIYVANFVAGSSPSYRVTTYLPDGTQTSPTITAGLCGPDAVAIDRHFKIYVVSVCGGVNIYSPDGTQVGTITDGLNGPQGITIDLNGKIYVTNYSSSGQSFVTTYRPDGTRTTPTITTGMNFPEGILVDGSGKIYVSNFGSNDVTTYRADGTQLSSITAGFDGPEGMAFNDGKLYVANINGNNVTTYRKKSGKQGSPTISGLNTPIGIAFH